MSYVYVLECTYKGHHTLGLFSTKELAKISLEKAMRIELCSMYEFVVKPVYISELSNKYYILARVSYGQSWIRNINIKEEDLPERKRISRISSLKWALVETDILYSLYTPNPIRFY